MAHSYKEDSQIREKFFNLTFSMKNFTFDHLGTSDQMWWVRVLQVVTVFLNLNSEENVSIKA